jgi:spermidine synthase
MLRLVALLLTVGTGFSGLVYEVCWQKYVATLLGSHSEATASVLGIFLAGLSLGYALFGRVTKQLVTRADREARAPRLFLTYGAVEAAIGVYALGFPWLFGWVRSLSLGIPHAVGGLGFAFDVVLVALLLGPPTVLMGGTIPLLTQALSRDLEHATRFHALVYACNTIGGFAGALVGSFALIPTLGLSGTMLWMSALNLAAGGLFALFEARGGDTGREAVRDAAAEATSIAGLRSYALVALLCGFALMVLQNVFIRLCGLSLGSSEYTFATVVAVFVLCIAVGSFAVSIAPRIPRRAPLWNLVLLVAYLGLLYPFLEKMPLWAYVLRSRFDNSDAAFLPFQLSTFLAFAALIGPAAILSGAVLPLLFHHLRRQLGGLGAVAGSLYSWNTLGSLLGALIGGYALLSVLDLHHVYRLALLALAAGAAILAFSLAARGLGLVSVSALAVAMLGIGLLPAWNPAYSVWGLFRHRDQKDVAFATIDASAEAMLEDPTRRVLYYDDDPAASIAVLEIEHAGGKISRSIVSNGKGDGDTIADYVTMAMAALVPSLLVEAPRKVFVVGLGTGVTVGEFAVQDSVEEVTVAEISSAVIEAVPYFDSANHGVSRHPKVRIVEGDAYRAILQSDERYDIIASEPSNPWVTGVEMLFSREFLSAAREHLTPEGVYVHWYHQYETDEQAVALVLRTFASVFDRVAVWYAQGPDLLLLGFNDDDLFPTPESVARRMADPALAAGLERAGIRTLSALLAHELLPMGVTALREPDGPIHTLDRPLLNHLAGRAFFRGAAGRLPEVEDGEAVELGARNSLLRRHLKQTQGVDAGTAREAATREACLYRKGLCVALLVEWKHLEPDSPALRELLATRNDEHAQRYEGEIPETLLPSLLRITSPSSARAAVPLDQVEQASLLYRRFFRYPAPFDSEPLIALWQRCSRPPERCAEGLERALRLRPPDRIGVH